MKKKVFYTVLIIFILSLIPMYAIGMYAHPSVDDYYYGDLTRVVWEETHSLSAVISASFDEMLTTYDEWQGNFSAIFLMRLQPGIFGEQYYSIAPFILITTYVLCSLLFYYVALKNIFNADRLRSSIVAVCITFVSIQLVDTPSDSFYWFNGSIYYTFFHSLMLLMFSLMIIIKKMHGPIIILPCLGSILLAFFIGGSNFATALFTAIVLTLTAFYTIYCARNRRNGFYMAHGFIYWLIFFAALTGLFLSIKAPGNAVRQASVGQSSSLIITFIYTFAYGGYSLASMLDAPCLIFFICILPVLYRIAKKSSLSYRYPLAVLIFTFGLYCSLGTPVFYAQGLRIPYRMMNIIYFNAYSFVGFNLLYLTGWISRRYGNTELIQSLEAFCDKIKSNNRSVITAFLVCIFMFFTACIGRIEVGETENKSGKAAFSNLTTSMAAVYSLVNGDASTFDEEMTLRDEYLRASTEENVAVPALTAYPELIFRVDITTDPGDWHNAHVAKFYHKNTVRLLTSPTP